MHSLVIISFMLLASVAAFLMHRLVRRFFDPRRSMGSLLMFLFMHAIFIFLLAYMAGLLIIWYGNWFRKT